MINYIFELLSFICAVSSYIKGDIKLTAIWIAATVIFGCCGTFGEIIYRKEKERGGSK